MIVAVEASETTPAEFIPAFSTHHMFATAIFLNKDATLGAGLFE
jgi:hypothetical protein